jgi:hypothetical protein
MSRSSHLQLDLYGKEFDPLGILAILLEHEWTIDDHGGITYLPLGDNGEFAWEGVPLTEVQSVMNILREKEEHGELIGIVLLWGESKIGGSFLIDKKERSVSVSLDTNRKEHDEYPITDIGWYLGKLIPPLLASGYEIERIDWVDSV